MTPVAEDEAEEDLKALEEDAVGTEEEPTVDGCHRLQQQKTKPA